MIQKFIFVTIICLFGTVAVSADLPDSSKLPRMPDAYRNNDYKDLTKRNPFGMSVYDVAEREAEEDLFSTEVVSLEESRKILEERKRKKEEQKNKE
ncbi:MAG: hypothetical protein KAR01_09180 [Desulfocapsa sp.]|nr:hypothetical protein [Desulfocapsa sp.]